MSYEDFAVLKTCTWLVFLVSNAIERLSTPKTHQGAKYFDPRGRQRACATDGGGDSRRSEDERRSVGNDPTALAQIRARQNPELRPEVAEGRGRGEGSGRRPRLFREKAELFSQEGGGSRR